MQINDTFSYLGDDVMIKLLSKHNRWRDVIDIRNTEVKLSVIFTIVLTIAAFRFSIYENFYLISEQVQNLLLEILSAMIGFIGIALSGVAIITGLFSQKEIEAIERVNGKNKFEQIMSSFLYISLCCACYTMLICVTYICIALNRPAVNRISFYIFIAFMIYGICFIMFYIVSLVGNCIRIFSIRNKYNKTQEKTLYEKANEIRVDLLFKIILENLHAEEDFSDFIKLLEKYTKEYDPKNADEIIDYFHSYYKAGNDKTNKK